MSYITCPHCGSEYWLEHIKLPMKDNGDYVSCSKCGTILHQWGKGTDDYSLIPVEEMRKRQAREEMIRQKAPTCPRCNTKMTLKSGSYGWFWGCSKYPSCDYTKNIRESDKELL